MRARTMEGLELIRESRPYIDCLYSILTSTGKFKGPKYLLSGMTGFAFIFVAHKNLIPAGTEMYDLRATAWNGLDLLGYYSEIFDGLKTSLTFPLYQKKAIKRVKESIDEGMAVIVWAAGITDFAVIFGYDEEDEVFFYKDRYHREEQVLLYGNLGKAEASYWMCHIIGERIEKDVRDIYLDSLEFAIDWWETPYKNEVTMRRELASGRKAYEYLIDALVKDDFHEYGAGRTIHYNIVSREEAYRYLSDVKEELPEVYPAYCKYKELHEIYHQMKGLIPPLYAPCQKFRIDRVNQLPRLIEYCIEAAQVEEEAVGELKNILQESLNNRYIDLFDVKKFN